jgi:hypothetical protein
VLPANALGAVFADNLAGLKALSLFPLARAGQLVRAGSAHRRDLAPSDRELTNTLPAAINELNKGNKVTPETLLDSLTREEVAATILKFYQLAACVPGNAPWVNAMAHAAIAMASASLSCLRPGLILQLELFLREAVLAAFVAGTPLPDVSKGSPLYTSAFHTEVSEPVSEFAMLNHPGAAPQTEAPRRALSKQEWLPRDRTAYAPSRDDSRAYDRASRPREPSSSKPTAPEPCHNYNSVRGCASQSCKYDHVCDMGCKPPGNLHPSSSRSCPSHHASARAPRK